MALALWHRDGTSRARLYAGGGNGKQVTDQEIIFRARADAHSKAWQQAIGNLHKSATSFAADRRGEMEAAVKRLESEPDAAKVKLES